MLVAVITITFVVPAWNHTLLDSGHTTFAQAQTQPSEVDFRNHQYAPQALTLRNGDTIRICNRDSIYHSPFSLSAYNKFNGAQLPREQCESVTVHNPTNRTISAQLFCDIHPNEKLVLTIFGSTQAQETVSLPQKMTVCHKIECIWPTYLTLVKREGDSATYKGTTFSKLDASATLDVEKDGKFVFVISATNGYAGTYTGYRQGDEIVGTYDPRTGNAGFGMPAPFKATIEGWSQPPQPPPALNDEGNHPVATLTAIKGDVFVRHQDGEEWEEGRIGMVLGHDDEVRTGPDSAATLEAWGNNWRLDVEELSHVYPSTLESQESRLKVRVLLQMGYVKAHVVRQRTLLTDFSVQTPTATAGVRGTIFSVRYDPRQQNTSIMVEEGSVFVEPRNSEFAPFALTANQQVQVSAQQVGAITSTNAALARTNTVGPVVGGVPWPTEKDGYTLLGTNLSFSPINSVAECRAKCANNQQCRGFAFVKRGAFESNPNNGVCYLLSSVTNQVSAACCVSGFRQ
jgi:hypothetical protein